MATEVKARGADGKFTKKEPAVTSDKSASADMVADVNAENEKLRQELAEAKAQAERWKPTVDIADRLFTKPEQVAARFDPQTLKDIAGAELAQINSERLRRGFLPIDWDDAEWSQALETTKEDLIADRTRWVSQAGAAARVLKMVKPTKDACPNQPCYRHGTLVQIPVENQINNQAGSMSDGIVRYKDKGFKLCEPFLCAMVDCWEPAKVENGKFLHAGYCSEDHRGRVEGGQGAAVVKNVITSQNVM